MRGVPSLKQKKQSFDLQELLMANDSPWLDSNPRTNFQMGEDKETVHGDWVDKVMVNKHEAVIRDDDSLRDWEGDRAPLPDFFYQRYLSDMGAYPEQYHGNATRRKDSHDFDERTAFQSGIEASPSMLAQSFCPAAAIMKLPYKYMRGTTAQMIGSRFFDAGRFWAREWDL